LLLYRKTSIRCEFVCYWFYDVHENSNMCNKMLGLYSMGLAARGIGNNRWDWEGDGKPRKAGERKWKWE